MKKALTFAVVAMSVALPLASMAQPTIPPVSLTYGSVVTLINTVANWIFGILLAISIIFILFAAYDYLTGDEGKIETAKHRLLSAAIAIGIALLAKGVGTLVASFLGSAGLGTGTLPQ